jgi:CBS domain-containing protein/sporulation protein YlmC with PRC-barrel domain
LVLGQKWNPYFEFCASNQANLRDLGRFLISKSFYRKKIILIRSFCVNKGKNECGELMGKVIYFSQINGKPIYDDRGYNVGSMEDLVFKDGEELAEITHFVMKINKNVFKLPWSFVGSVGHSIYLNTVKENLTHSDIKDSDLLVNSVLMDRQLVDTDGLKVVRVNDVLLSKIESKFYISGVDVGTSGLLRRLGVEGLAMAIKPKSSANIVPWNYVQPLSLSPNNLSVSLSKSKINEVHPADIADLMDELTHSERQILFSALDEKTAAETFIEAEPEVQRSLVEHLNEKKINSIVRKLSPFQIANLVRVASAASKGRLNSLINKMDEKILKRIDDIMRYPSESAAALMKSEFFSIPDDYTISKTAKFFKTIQNRGELYYLYVVNADGHLKGVMSLKDLFFQKPNAKVSDFMKTKIIYVGVNDSIRKVARTFRKYHLHALPVIDSSQKLIGIISVNDVFEEVFPNSWKKATVIAKRLRGKSSKKKKPKQ